MKRYLFLATLVAASPAVGQDVGYLGLNPTTPALIYGQPSDPFSSLVGQREHYTFSGTHTPPWAGRSVEVYENGSGTLGPSHAAYGLSVNVWRNGFPTSTAVGENDGISSVTRTTIGDTSGFLANAGTVQGVAEGFESSSSTYDNTGALTGSIQAQVGVAYDTGEAGESGRGSRGFATLCNTGTCTSAYFSGQNGGVFADFLENSVGIASSPTIVTRITGDGTQSDFGKSLSTADARLTLGLSRTGAGNSYIDLIGDTTYGGYGLRILRNAGANGQGGFYWRGSGQFSVDAQDSTGSVALQVGTASLLVATSTAITLPGGALTLPETPASAVNTPPNGSQTLFLDTSDHKLKRKDSTGAVSIIG